MKEVLDFLVPERGGIFVDGTLGLGGHTKALLERGGEKIQIYAFEWNEDTLERVTQELKPFSDRVKIIPKNFIFIKEELMKAKVMANGVLLDLGLSSFLLEASQRGFSFQRDEPLDMRMSLSLKETAKEILNFYSQKELYELFKKGEVPRAYQFSIFIVKRRKKYPLERTQDLVRAIQEFYRPSPNQEKDLKALIFQALRIKVNQELENLEKALETIPDILKPGGRLAVISFHSLEDRLVKKAFKEDLRLNPLTKKPILPTWEEIRENLRARSAKLRVAERR